MRCPDSLRLSDVWSQVEASYTHDLNLKGQLAHKREVTVGQRNAISWILKCFINRSTIAL